VALSSFQQAMGDLVRSPALCRALLATPEQVLPRYDLSAREQRRLVAIAGQRGMALLAALHNAGRLAPIQTLLPHTCFLLGPQLAVEYERYWGFHEDSALPFGPEADRFAAFLQARLRGGVTLSPFLPEILDFERATNALRYLPAREEGAADIGPADGDRLQLHPLVRLVRFRHEPMRLLRCLTDGLAPPADLATGEFWVLLRAGQSPPDGTPTDQAETDGLVVERIDPALGHALAMLRDGVNAAALGAGEAAALIDAGLAVRGRSPGRP
jgi:hypothetical protein